MGTAIGFIGVGTMGRPMVLNLLKAGHRVTVYDVRPEASPPQGDESAAPAGNPRHPAAGGAGPQGKMGAGLSPSMARRWQDRRARRRRRAMW